MDNLKIQPEKFCGSSESAQMFCGGASKKCGLARTFCSSAFAVSAARSKC